MSAVSEITELGGLIIWCNLCFDSLDEPGDVVLPMTVYETWPA